MLTFLNFIPHLTLHINHVLFILLCSLKSLIGCNILSTPAPVTLPLSYIYIIHNNVVEAHGYGLRSTVVSGEHSRSKTSAIIAMYDVSTTRVSFVPDEDPRG